MSEQVTGQPASGNPFARIIGVIFSPGKTFSEIADRPSWVGALLVYFILVGIGFGIYSMKADWATIISDQLENSAFFSFVPENQKDQILAQSTENIRKLSQFEITISTLVGQVYAGVMLIGHFWLVILCTLFVMMGTAADLRLGRAWLSFLVGLGITIAYAGIAFVGQAAFAEAPGNSAMLNTAAGVVLIGVWIWLLNKFALKDRSFHAMLGVFAHATAVLAVGGLALGLVSALQPAPIQVAADKIVKSSVGSLVSTEIAALDSLLDRLDIFVLWWLAVLTMGFKAVAKTSTGLAASLTILPWAVIALIMVAWAAVFG